MCTSAPCAASAIGSMSPPSRTAGIRRRLLANLLLPLTLLVLLSVAVDYRIAFAPANEAYDQQLSDAALIVAAHLRTEKDRPVLSMSGQAEAVLRFDSDDRVYYAVRDQAGQLVAGDAELGPVDAGSAANPSFYDADISGIHIRGALYRVPSDTGPLTIQVAETTIKRQLLARRILSAQLIPFLLLTLLFVGVIVFGIRTALAPLGRLRADVEGRSPQQLHPLPEDTVPVEVQPLIAAINGLLAQVAAAAAAEQRFLSNAAHQLRTPLSALQTQLELADMESDPGKQKARLQQLRQATERVGRLVQQLLALARATPSAAGQDLRPLDLCELVEQFASGYVDAALAREIDLGYEREPAPVKGIALLLREALANLVDNALRYTPQGGHVTVRTRREGDHCLLEVEDDGPGIPQELRQKVFDRFYRPPGSPGDGCGLGLAIVKEIAEAHGGRVDILDPASPHGTRLRITLPAAK